MAYSKELDYNKKQYNAFGWARANGILSSRENALFHKALSDIKLGEHYEKTSDGEYMIPVGENGVLNKIIFTNGNYVNPKISKVIEIDLDNETELSDFRKVVYDNERKGNRIRQEDSPLFSIHFKTSFEYDDYIRKSKTSSSNSDGIGDRRRSSGETQEIKYAKDLKERGSANTRNELAYSDNVKYSKKQKKYISYGNSLKTIAEKQLKKYYKDSGETIIDGFPVIDGNKLYIVDSGIDDNYVVAFGLFEKQEYADEETARYFRGLIIDEINRNGYYSGGKVKTIRPNNGSYNSRSGKQGTFGEVLQDNNGESRYNSGGIFEENGNRKSLKSDSNTKYAKDLIKTNEKEETKPTPSTETYKSIETTKDIVDIVKNSVEKVKGQDIVIHFLKNIDDFVEKSFTQINTAKKLETEAKRITNSFLDTTFEQLDEDTKKYEVIGTLKTALTPIDQADLEAITKEIIKNIDKKGLTTKSILLIFKWRARHESNVRPQPSEGCALSPELRAQ